MNPVTVSNTALGVIALGGFASIPYGVGVLCVASVAAVGLLAANEVVEWFGE